MDELNKYKVDVNKTKEDKNEFVSCIIIDKKGRPLRLKRSDNEKIDPGKYDLCSGHIKNDEIPLHAIIREVDEELKIQYNDVIELFKLGEIQTPHLKFKDTITHMYCMVINLETEGINKNLQQENKQNEIMKAEFLDSIDDLENQLNNPDSNWRIVMTQEVKEQLNKVRKLILKESCVENYIR